MPMSFDASQCFKFCAVAGCKYPSVFSPPAFVFMGAINPNLPTDQTL
jgi:hypothetical protein